MGPVMSNTDHINTECSLTLYTMRQRYKKFTGTNKLSADRGSRIDILNYALFPSK
jgi:hypothetical protein